MRTADSSVRRDFGEQNCSECNLHGLTAVLAVVKSATRGSNIQWSRGRNARLLIEGIALLSSACRRVISDPGPVLIMLKYSLLVRFAGVVCAEDACRSDK